MTVEYPMRPIGVVVSSVTDPANAALQGDEGAPETRIHIDPALEPTLRGVEAGNEALVLTWLHLARRNLLELSPRGDASRPPVGVFSSGRLIGRTRSACTA